jgi:hypothetical protein
MGGQACQTERAATGSPLASLAIYDGITGNHDQPKSRGQRALARVSSFLRKEGTPGIFEELCVRLQLVDGKLQRPRYSLEMVDD